MALAAGNPLPGRLLVDGEMHEDDARAVPAQPVAIDALQRRAGGDGALATDRQFRKLPADRVEPSGPVCVVEDLVPFLPGGNSGVTPDGSGLAYGDMPGRLEGGTHDIPAILALGAALDVLGEIGLGVIAEHNRILTHRLIDGLRPLPGLEFTPGPAHAPCEIGYGTVSFTLAGIRSTDLGFILAEAGFLVRTGAHCVPPAGGRGEDDSVRVSTHIYTTADDIDRFVACLAEIAREVGP